MDDALLVRRIERVGNLPGDGERVGVRDWAARNVVGEGGAIDEFQDEKRSGVALIEAEDLSDVGMVQRREQPRFTRKPRKAIAVAVRERWALSTAASCTRNSPDG